MTSQSSEKLENEHPSFDMGVWSVFATIRGEPAKENHGWGSRLPSGERMKVYASEPGEAEVVTTGNWSGFHEVYRLAADGSLTLVRFEYDARDVPPRVVDERLTGDFYLVMKAAFEGPRLYVPFRAGLLVTERDAWLHEDYIGNSPIATELRRGVHPAFPGRPRLWYE